MMKRIFLLVILVATALAGFSQEMRGIEAQTNLQMLGGGSYTARTFDNRYDGIKGSPTLFITPLPCLIITSDDRKFSSKQGNFDIYTNELVIVRGNQELVMSASTVKSFSFLNGTDSIRFVKASLKEGAVSYLQQLETGNYKLLKLYKKQFLKADYKGAYSAGRTQDEFTDDQAYYVQVNERFAEVKNKKDLLRAMPEKADQTEALIKSNKLDLKNENDLRALVAELNRTR